MSTTVLPTAGAWAIDPSHTSVEFVVKHLVVAKVRGRFSNVAGTVVVAEPTADSSVDVTIEAASFSTGDAQRDGHVLSPDFLDVERFPTLTFRGSGPRDAGGGRWVLPGELTIRDVTRPVELTVEPLGIVTDPWGNTKAGFSATASIDREDFGITWNQALEAGGVLVSREVRIEIEAQLAPQA